MMYDDSLYVRCCICQRTEISLTVTISLLERHLLQGHFMCQNCNEDAKSVINLATNLEDVSSGTNRPFVKVISSMMKMTGKETDFKKKISGMDKEIIFMRESLSAIKDQIQSDVEVKPGCNGPSRPAQRALLAAKSGIFKNILAEINADSDDVKAQSDTIMLAEINAEELESLIEFLYMGYLSKEKLEKHASALFVAAHKYEISYLGEVCASHLQASLTKANVFDLLETSDAFSHTPLKDACMSYILHNMEDFVFSDEYESFMLKYPTICMEVTREFVSKKKKERRDMAPETFVHKLDIKDQISAIGVKNMTEYQLEQQRMRVGSLPVRLNNTHEDKKRGAEIKPEDKRTRRI